MLGSCPEVPGVSVLYSITISDNPSTKILIVILVLQRMRRSLSSLNSVSFQGASSPQGLI
jgi:hypothetical protein